MPSGAWHVWDRQRRRCLDLPFGLALHVARVAWEKRGGGSRELGYSEHVGEKRLIKTIVSYGALLCFTLEYLNHEN